MKTINHIILDFDGTIADTRQSIIATVQQTLQTLQLPMPTHDAIQALIGLPLRDTFVKAANIIDEAILKQAISTYRALYNDISQTTVTLFPHVAETLQTLHQAGVIITIASNKGKAALTRLLDRLGISSYIAYVCGEQDVQNKKPAPDMALFLLQETDTEACQTMVVGDTIYDIMMGQQANCRTCGVTYGNHSAEALQKQGADYIMDDFAQVLNICTT